MGKVKYRKHIDSDAGSKTEKKSSFASKKSSISWYKYEISPSTFRERRQAITSLDLGADDKLALVLRRHLQSKSVEKECDGLHLTKQDKRVLARKKMAGAFDNMGSLVAALPDLGKEVKNRSVKEKPRLSKSFKTQEMEMVKDIQWYRSAIQDPSFQTDPFAAIAANIHVRLENEQKGFS